MCNYQTGSSLFNVTGRVICQNTKQVDEPTQRQYQLDKIVLIM